MVTTTKSMPEKIEDQVRRWRHNRGRYPGWVVIPSANLNTLWEKTEHWIQPILSHAQAAAPAQRLVWLRELTWRYETCLMPLWSEYAVRIEEALEDVMPFSDMRQISVAKLRPTPENIGELDWPELAEAWLALKLSLIRYSRETNALDSFMKLSISLDQFAEHNTEVISALAYERCLYALERLDHAQCNRVLSKWEAAELPDPFWQVRRAAIRAEVGKAVEAEKEADAALRAVRERYRRDSSNRAGTEDIASLSQEGWAMMLVRGVKMGLRIFSGDPAPDFRGRWEKLGEFRCNPWPEIERLQIILGSPPPAMTEAESNRRGGNQVRVIFGGQGTFQRLAPALRAARLLEEAAFPVRAPNVTLGAGLLRRAVEWLGSELPSRALPLLLRLGEDSPLKDFLSYHRVAALTMEDAELVRTLAISTLEQAVPAYLSATGEHEHAASGAHQRVVLALRMLSAIVARLDGGALDDAISRALALRSQPQFTLRNDIWQLLNTVVARSLAAMPAKQVERHVLAIVSQPLLGLEINTIGAQWTDDVTFHLLSPLASADRATAPTQWNDVIRRLLRHATDAPDTARAQAIFRCAVLHHMGLLKSPEIKQLLRVTWPQTAEKFHWPRLPLIPACFILLLPEPKPGDAVAAFKANILSRSLSRFRVPMTKVDGTEGLGWRLSNDIDDAFLNVTQATLRPWETVDRRPIPAISWTDAEADRLIAMAEDWWKDEGRDLAQQVHGDPFGISKEVLRRRIEHLIGVFAYAILPALPPRHSALNRAASFLSDLRDAGIVTESTLVIAIAADPDAAERVASELRISLVSMDAMVAAAAIEGVYVWLEAAARDQIPRPPSDLVHEIGAIVRARRLPALAAALRYASYILRRPQPDAAGKLVIDDVRVGLQYLVAETRYRRSFDPKSSLAYDEVPELRALAAQLAGALSLYVGMGDQAVKLWAAEMEKEPLAEVRFAMDAGRQA